MKDNKILKFMLVIIVIILLSILISAVYIKFIRKDDGRLYDAETGEPCEITEPSYLTHIIANSDSSSEVNSLITKSTFIYTFDKNNVCVGIRYITEYKDEAKAKEVYDSYKDSVYKQAELEGVTLKVTMPGSKSLTKEKVIDNSSMMEYVIY